MDDKDREFQRLYVQAKSLSDSKDIFQAISACKALISVSKDNQEQLDKAFTVYRYVYGRSNPSSVPYSWFANGILQDFPDLSDRNPQLTKISSQTSLEDIREGDVWERVKFIAKLSRKSDASEIKNFLMERNVKSLLHFSHASNLNSIISHGILGRETLAERGLPFYKTDERRLDLLSNAISLSFTRPNLLMLSFKTSTLKTEDWIVFDISPQILLSEDFAAFPSNAAATEVTNAFRRDPGKFCGIRGLRQMFLDGKASTRASTNTGKKISREELGLPENQPTDPQAELMLLSQVKVPNINRILISTSATRKYSEIIDKIEVSIPTLTIQRNFKLLDSPIDISGLKERTLSWESIDQAMR